MTFGRPRSNAAATFTYVGEDFLYADLIDNFDSLRTHAQLNPALLGRHPKTLVLEVRLEPAFRPVVGVGYVVTRHGLFPRHHTEFTHGPVSPSPVVPAPRTDNIHPPDTLPVVPQRRHS